MLFLKFSLVCATALAVNGADLPSFLTPCSSSSPTDELTTCITAQARKAQGAFTKGLAEFQLEALDPLTLPAVAAKAGTFNLKSTNVVVKGLKNIDIKELKWDLAGLTGHMKLFGNLTFTSDYQTDGRLLLIPITGNGKLTVKMYDTDMLISFKLKKYQSDGEEYIKTYDLKATQTYGNVKIHMSNIVGGAVVGDTINYVLNDNWRELMKEVGPPYIAAVAEKVHQILNEFYKNVPLKKLLS